MPSTNKTGQTWNTEPYAANGRFVATLAADAVTLLNPKPGEEILDLGCGDGALTQQLAATGAIVTGVDASPTMLAALRDVEGNWTADYVRLRSTPPDHKLAPTHVRGECSHQAIPRREERIVFSK